MAYPPIFFNVASVLCCQAEPATNASLVALYEVGLLLQPNQGNPWMTGGLSGCGW